MAPLTEQPPWALYLVVSLSVALGVCVLCTWTTRLLRAWAEAEARLARVGPAGSRAAADGPAHLGDSDRAQGSGSLDSAAAPGPAAGPPRAPAFPPRRPGMWGPAPPRRSGSVRPAPTAADADRAYAEQIMAYLRSRAAGLGSESTPRSSGSIPAAAAAAYHRAIVRTDVQPVPLRGGWSTAGAGAAWGAGLPPGPPSPARLPTEAAQLSPSGGLHTDILDLLPRLRAIELPAAGPGPGPAAAEPLPGARSEHESPVADSGSEPPGAVAAAARPRLAIPRPHIALPQAGPRGTGLQQALGPGAAGAAAAASGSGWAPGPRPRPDYKPGGSASASVADSGAGAGAGHGAGGLRAPRLDLLPRAAGQGPELGVRESDLDPDPERWARLAGGPGCGGGAGAGLGSAASPPAPRPEHLALLLLDEACSICLDGFAAHQLVTALPCCHTFHAACARRWLKYQGSCPTCRARVADGLAAAAARLGHAARGRGSGSAS